MEQQQQAGCHWRLNCDFVVQVDVSWNNNNNNNGIWLARGWCRAEPWCRLLSNRPDTSVVVIFSAREKDPLHFILGLAKKFDLRWFVYGGK